MKFVMASLTQYKKVLLLTLPPSSEVGSVVDMQPAIRITKLAPVLSTLPGLPCQPLPMPGSQVFIVRYVAKSHYPTRSPIGATAIEPHL